MAEGTPENQITYFTVQGHSHDGVNSSIVDFSGYDIYDFISESDLRRVILDAVNDGPIEPQGGIRISPAGGGGGVFFGPDVPGAANGLSHTCSINEDGASIRNVTWLKSDNATSYIIELHRSIDNGSNYLKVQEVTTKLLGHSFEQTPMANTTLTKYKLALYPQSDAGIIGTYQELSNISPCVDTTAPAGPLFEDGTSSPNVPNHLVSFRGFLARLQEQTEADTKWGIGEFEYSVSTSLASEGQWVSNQAESGRQTGRIISVTGLATGTAYYLRVRAIDNSNNTSPWTYWNGLGDDGDSTMANADSFTPVEITGTEITSNSITTSHIQANQIVSNLIAADQVTANEIAANAVEADHIKANELFVGVGIESNSYSAGTAGFKINYDGTAEFNNNVTMKGATISDSSLTVNSGSPSEVKFRVTTAGNTTINGTLTVGDYAGGKGMNWDGSDLTVKGSIVSIDGTIGGWALASGKIHSTADTSGAGGTAADGGPGITVDDIVLGLTNQAVSVGDGRGVMRRYRFAALGNGVGDVKIGIDASAGMNPKYNTSGDMLMWWDESESLAKFSLSDKLLFDGSNLSLTDGTITSGTIQTATSGSRLTLSPVNALPDVTEDTGTAQAGASATITLKSGSSGTNDYYNDLTITLTGGPGNGDVRIISDYVGSSKVATVSAAWTTNPTSSTTYTLTRKTNTFLRGYTGKTTEDYPGFIYYYGERDSVTQSRQWGRVAFSSPRFSATIAYTGFVFSHSDDGWGELTFGLPNHADQFVIADAGSGSTPTNTFNRGGITIASGAPASNTYTLYNDSGTLKWNGSAIGGSSGVDSIIAGSNITLSPSGGTGDVTVTATDTTYTASSPLTLAGGAFGLDTANIVWSSSTNLGISAWSGSMANADSILVKNHTGNPNTAGTVYWFSLATYLSNTNVSAFTNDAGYMTASSSNTLTNKGGNISQWTNDSGYVTSATVSFPLSGTAGSTSAPTYGFGGASGDSHTGMYQANNDQIGFAVGASSRMIITTAGLSNLRTLQPAQDNTYSLGLGTSSYRWKNGYFSNNVYTHDGGVHASDAAQKTDVADATLGLDFVKGLRPVSYKWIETGDGAGVRTHQGFIAQEIETLLGDDAASMGIWCNVHQPALSKDDYPIEEDVEESYTPSLRYTEFVPILTKAIQELEARLAALEA
jgi:hypothetical protein